MFYIIIIFVSGAKWFANIMFVFAINLQTERIWQKLIFACSISLRKIVSKVDLCNQICKQANLCKIEFSDTYETTFYIAITAMANMQQEYSCFIYKLRILAKIRRFGIFQLHNDFTNTFSNTGFS